MKKLIIAALATLAVACSDNSSSIPPAIEPDKYIEEEIVELMSEMSLEDKVGQMCQLTVGTILSNSTNNGVPVLDHSKVRSAFKEFRVGSVLNAPLDHAQDTAAWRSVIGGIQEASVEYIGIPDIYGVDQNHGTTYTVGGTLFPQEINMAASFNRQLVREGAQVCAYETRACAIPWVFNPVMDLGRNPVWSRIWESFGEDPYINGQMAVQMVKGYQGDDPNHIGQMGVAACLKHFMAYGNPVSGQDRTPSSVNAMDMREKYFAPYKEAIRAGALSIMVNSGVNNGVPFHANHQMLTEWLKEGLNWDGVIVTDWADIHNLWNRDKVAADYKEAIKLAINAGIDMSMTPYDTEFCTLLKELVQEGEVSQERIDDAVARILRMKMRLGLFRMPMPDPDDYPLFGSAQHAEKALEMAVQSEILLKNNGILPLATGKKILVTGPNANSIRCLNGGWSYMWQGCDDARFTEPYNTIYEALALRFGEQNVRLEEGMDYVQEHGKWQDEVNLRIDKAVAEARSADVIVACVGENSYCETVGNINNLALSDNQTNLVKALAATGKPVILVINGGRPRIVREIEPLAAAVVDILLPGNYGGDALAKLLAGDRNFSAKLPYTYPKWPNSLTTYDHKPCESVGTMAGAYDYTADIDVQWPFGFGMSYTSFEYSDIAVDKNEFSADDTLNISVTVTNTGSMDGMEPVVLYSSDLVASVTPDVLRVRDFDKVSLAPGQSTRVSFALPAANLAFVNPDGKWTLEKGTFRFTIGARTVDAVCTATKVWNSPEFYFDL